MAATETAPHLCIDPHQTEYYADVGLQNLSGLGFTDRLTLIRERSADALPRLVGEGGRFDFAFVDGGHRFDEIFIDWAYLDRLMDVGGVLVFDDLWMRPTQLVLGFIERNRADYRRLTSRQRNFALFERTGADSRPWDHFEEFYNRRSAADFERYRRDGDPPSWLRRGRQGE
jgi:predicted O-methyltransferase YrrM